MCSFNVHHFGFIHNLSLIGYETLVCIILEKPPFPITADEKRESSSQISASFSKGKGNSTFLKFPDRWVIPIST